MRDEETARQTINAWYEANPSAHLGEKPARALVAAVAAALADARRAERGRIARAIRDDWRVQHTISVDELVELVCALE